MWHQIIQQTSVKDLVRMKHRSVIELDAGSTLGSALHTLSKYDIISAPVRDGKVILGFLDVLDITGYILNEYKRESKSMHNQVHFPRHFLDIPIRNLINFSKWDDPILVMESDTVHDLIQILSSSARHFVPHRVGVMNINNQLVNILSQMDVITFLHANMGSLLESVRSRPVGDLRIIKSPIFVRLDDPFIDAITTLYDARVTGIGLTDDQGRITGNLSASDLRGILPDAFDYFSGSTIQFLVKGTNSRTAAPVTCTKSTTFEELVALFVNQHVHRVYVLDDTFYPSGIITLTDILQGMQ
jgi:CBS domain-containing protein